jgi:hypothetical protein
VPCSDSAAAAAAESGAEPAELRDDVWALAVSDSGRRGSGWRPWAG